MTALVSAELLRLRTVRSPRYAALGLFALGALLAGLEVTGPGFGGGPGLPPRGDSLRLLAYNGVIFVAVFGAHVAAVEFPRGAIALTYLVQPDRWRVTRARSLTHGVVGAIVAALAIGIALAVGLGGEGPRHLPAGPSPTGGLPARPGSGSR